MQSSQKLLTLHWVINHVHFWSFGVFLLVIEKVLLFALVSIDYILFQLSLSELGLLIVQPVVFFMIFVLF